MKTLFVLIMILTLTTAAFSQKEMTKEEAAAFINQHVAAISGIKSSDGARIYGPSSLVIDGGRLRHTLSQQEASKPVELLTETNYFNPAQLKEIQPCHTSWETASTGCVVLTFEQKSVDQVLESGPHGANSQTLYNSDFVSSGHNVWVLFTKGDGTVGAKINAALLRLKAIYEAESAGKPADPGLAVTLEWLQTKFKAFGSGFARHRNQDGRWMFLNNGEADVQFRGCNMYVMPKFSDRQAIPLKDVDSARLTVIAVSNQPLWEIVIYSRNNQPFPGWSDRDPGTEPRFQHLGGRSPPTGSCSRSTTRTPPTG